MHKITMSCQNSESAVSWHSACWPGIFHVAETDVAGPIALQAGNSKLNPAHEQEDPGIIAAGELRGVRKPLRTSFGAVRSNMAQQASAVNTQIMLNDMESISFRVTACTLPDILYQSFRLQGHKAILNIAILQTRRQKF